jgi:hypothetical protein
MNISDGEGQKPSWNPSTSKTDESLPEVASCPTSSSDNSPSPYNDNKDIIEFGPIKVKQRRKPALTLATGRRSKYEVLSPNEEQKREIRRARNRAAAERVRINRLNIEQELQGQIDALEIQEQALSNKIETLQYHKLNLETRILTHEKMCPTATITGFNPQHNLTPVFTANNPSTSVTFQRVEQASEINLDELFLNSPLPSQNQQDNYSNSLTTIILDIDPEEYLMNP